LATPTSAPADRSLVATDQELGINRLAGQIVVLGGEGSNAVYELTPR